MSKLLPSLAALPSSRLTTSLVAPAFVAIMALAGLSVQANAQCSGTGTTTYNSTGGVSVTANHVSTSTNVITVPSLPAGTTITCVSLVLNGVTTDGSTYSSMDYASFMLTAPSGQKFAFLGSTGDGSDGDDFNDAGSGLSNVNITVADNASTAAPEYGVSIWPHTGSLTVRPGSYYEAADNNTGLTPPLPVGGNAAQWAQSDGNGTFAKLFTTGATPSGGWTLSLTDDDPGPSGADPVSVTSWSLVMTTVQTSNVNTTTSLSSNTNPSFTSSTSSSVTLTATVTSGGNGTPTGTVQFTDGVSTIAGCGSVALSGGVATCTTTFASQGAHTLEANYSGTTGYNSSDSAGVNQFVENHPTNPGVNEYCNTGALTNNGANTSPDPSVINVPFLSGSVADVSVTLTGLTGTGGVPLDYGFLLVAPDGVHNLDFLDDAGVGGSQSFTDTVTISDGSAAAPFDGGLPSGTYGPTADSSTAPAFTSVAAPAPQLPASVNYAQPDLFGNTPLTLAQAFDGVNAQGPWALFMINTSGTSTPLNVTGGWCVSFTLNNGAPTTTTLNSSANPAWTGSSVSVVATVTSNGNPVTSGTVTITDNSTGATLASNVPLNGSGTVTYTGSALTEGDHDITAEYSGVNNTFDPSSTSAYWLRLNTHTTVTGQGTVASPALYCNPGGITLPNQQRVIDSGPAAPNPSNIFVSSLPGTVNSVQLELENFQNPPGQGADTMLWTSSLVVGPGATTANTLDFFTGTGLTNNDSLWSAGNYIFADSGSETVPQATYGPGTYEPTAYINSQVAAGFTASPSGFYNLPGSFQYAQPFNPAYTFGDVYGNTDANGTWSLYMNQNTAVDGAGATANGWCVSFIQNLPTATVTASHTGAIARGETNAQLQVNIMNNGPGSTGDPTGTNPMTVGDVLSSAFTYAGSSGSGWACSAAGQTVFCTNDDSIASGSNYPQLTIDVNVSNTATGSVSNQVTASGAGVSLVSSNTDTFTIQVPPTIASGSSTTFTVGTNGTFGVTATGAPTPSISEAGALPTGVALTDNGDGTATLAGTPLAGTGGVYPLVITAQNGITPNATQNFTLTVNQAPAITSGNSATFTPGTGGAFAVTTTGYPQASLSESGALPGGITFIDNGNGTATLAGTASASTAGNFPITITASNGVSPQAMQSFVLSLSPALAVITSPTQGSTLPSGTVNFAWSGGSNVSAYQLVIGSWGPGGGDLYNSYLILPTASSKTVTLPTGGIMIYVQLKQEINGVWYATNTTYTEAGTTVPAVISSPAPGSVLTTTTPTFSWAGVSGPNEFTLRVGSIGMSTSDIYYSGALFGTTSQMVTIPAKGMKIYVQLAQLYNGSWKTSEYTYTEPSTPAVINSPVSGSTLPGSSVTFDWSGGIGPTAYQVLVGTIQPGSGNILNTYSTHATSATVTVPTNGATLFVRLNQLIGATWQTTDYTYTEAGTLVPAVMNSPTPSSTLATSNVTFDWSGASGPVEYVLRVGTTGPGSSDVYYSGGITATSQNVTVPASGATVYVRLSQLISDVWRATDYTYTEP